jgi:hypothetical protein
MPVAETEFAVHYLLARSTKMMEILSTAQQGPHTYAPDEPENPELKHGEETAIFRSRDQATKVAGRRDVTYNSCLWSNSLGT